MDYRRKNMKICFHLGIQKLFCNKFEHIHTFGWYDLFKRWREKNKIDRKNDKVLIEFLIKKSKENEEKFYELSMILRDFVKLERDIYEIQELKNYFL